MAIVYYNAILDSIFVMESGEEESLIYYYHLTHKGRGDWVCLGEL